MGQLGPKRKLTIFRLRNPGKTFEANETCTISEPGQSDSSENLTSKSNAKIETILYELKYEGKPLQLLA